MEQIAMYLRLSKEDEFIRDESNSITNQRTFIRKYINKDKALRKMNVLEFVDDGFTGKNMDRPEMQRMLDLINHKEINCVIVKDFSRFSRNHIEQGKYIAAYAPFGYVKSPEDKQKLVVDEYTSQIVRRIFREFLSGKSMYKIAEALNLEGIEMPDVYIATRANNENQLAKYREKKPLWSNVTVGRILENEQYTGTMVYNRFKSENVGDKHDKALPEEEWKCVENCHVAIISKADFEKVVAKRFGNTCAGAERKHETHCLTGKMICGNCGHRLFHSYIGRPKYYCAKHYLDMTDGKCNISVLDSTMEEVVMKSLQLFIDMWVDSRKIVDMQREKQAQRLALAEKHLLDMEKSYERINKDLRDAYESYKLDMTDRETYLEQKKTYEQLLVRMQDNIEKQKAAVSKMDQVDLPEVASFEMLEGQMKLQKLNKEIVEAFMAEIVVHAKDRV